MPINSVQQALLGSPYRNVKSVIASNGTPGVVHLKGTVSTYHEKQIALETAKRELPNSGYRLCINNLLVKRD